MPRWIRQSGFTACPGIIRVPEEGNNREQVIKELSSAGGLFTGRTIRCQPTFRRNEANPILGHPTRQSAAPPADGVFTGRPIPVCPPAFRRNEANPISGHSSVAIIRGTSGARVRLNRFSMLH